MNYGSYHFSSLISNSYSQITLIYEILTPYAVSFAGRDFCEKKVKSFLGASKQRATSETLV